ncbi:MAG: transketolase [Legionellales bacterium]|nr:transketolase [Legionellales bacterium]
MPSQFDCANAIRALSMDAVQRANSGHPGMPMGMADIAQVLWSEFMNHNPANPSWFNRDRFVLSNGHGSMLLYSLLHLTGYDLSLEQLKNFRQLHSMTPGHPEIDEAPGVETTTGPLGQGIANAVGMALAEKLLADQFNQPGYELVDHWTYVFLGDGCLMEGISHEVCALAGTLGLGKLVVFWDDNGISIDGQVAPWFSDDTPKRFEAYGWEVISAVDGHDPAQLKKAIEQAKQQSDRPTLICCRTTIGFGSPNLAGSEKTHGAPLGDEEIAATREKLGWQHGPFEIPKPIYEAWDARAAGEEKQARWDALFSDYEKAHPQLAAAFKRRVNGELPKNWQQWSDALVKDTQNKAEDVATRKASLQVINELLTVLPECLGGSADLTGSNLTMHKKAKPVMPGESGDYLHYGVREFGMAAVMNGLALHGGFIPFGGTFLTFVDYMRNAVRMSALMKQRVIYVLTHDSIGLGEDGPTHQPVEQLASLRASPNLEAWRPCDTTETAVAWCQAIESKQTPSALVLSRQTLPHQARDEMALSQIKKGGYVLKDFGQSVDAIIVATGSEVALAMEAAEALTGKVNVRVVSMPCLDRFLAQPREYQEKVLPSSVTARVAVEAGASLPWYRIVGLQGSVVGLDRFGVSAPAKEAFKECGFTKDKIIAAVQSVYGS